MKTFILFFTLGMITYTFIPADIAVAQVRPINVSQARVNAISDDGCSNITIIKDIELQSGEKITAENEEVCK